MILVNREELPEKTAKLARYREISVLASCSLDKAETRQ